MATCLTPISIKPTKEKPARDGFFFHVVPCGKCAACRMRRIQGWVFRLRQEEKVHKSGWFVTLTYDKPPMSENGFMTLRKLDITNFLKRLRFNTDRTTIKYYACGEYGGKTFRPHYHMIIFDVTPDEVIEAWTTGHTPDDPVIRGFTHFGKITDDSIAYCAKYMAKESRIPLHDHDDRVKEHSRMSKGLGKNYLTPQIIRYHNDGKKYRSYLTMPGGATHAMPRYYRDRIFTDYEREHMNGTLSDKFDRAFQEDVKKAGSIEEHYRRMHYAVIQSNNNFLKANKRETI